MWSEGGKSGVRGRENPRDCFDSEIQNYRLECSLPVEDHNVCNSVLHTGKMKTEFVRILPHVQSFFSGFPRDLYH